MPTSTQVKAAPVQRRAPEPITVPHVHSNIPRFRRTYSLFSHNGIVTEGGGLVSGALRIQLRKGFKSQTRVMVAYAEHNVFVEVKGSPLRGDINPKLIFSLLRASGRVETSISVKK